jgi:hypothetical protein
LENIVTEEKKVEYNEAEAMLLGLDLDTQKEVEEKGRELPPDPNDWTEEDKARVAEIMKRLYHREEPEPETDLRDHFGKGEKFTDPNGMQTVVRSVGTKAMTLVVWGKKGRFVDGYEITLRGFIFETTRSRGNKTTIQLRGIAPKPEDSNGEAESK